MISTLSYDTQLVTNRPRAFLRAAGCVAELVQVVCAKPAVVCPTPFTWNHYVLPQSLSGENYFSRNLQLRTVEADLVRTQIKSYLGSERQTCGFLYIKCGCYGRNTQFHVSRLHNKHVTLVSPEPQGGAGMDLVKHTGGCHCGAVRFEVWSSPDLHVFHCNCSICTKKQNHHFIVPKNGFTLLQGLDSLTTYTFNTHVAQHTFCKTCGVQSFYTPRSNPDGYGIAPHCLDPGTVQSVTVEKFCGEKWEESVQAHKSIRDMSRPAPNTV